MTLEQKEALREGDEAVKACEVLLLTLIEEFKKEMFICDADPAVLLKQRMKVDGAQQLLQTFRLKLDKICARSK